MYIILIIKDKKRCINSLEDNELIVMLVIMNSALFRMMFKRKNKMIIQFSLI